MSRCVVFDLDGTLVDPGRGICESFNGALEFLNLPSAEEGWIRSQIGKPLPHMFAAHLNCALSEQIDELVYHYREKYLSAGFGFCELYPGINELLLSLCEHFEVGICTSKRFDIAEKILSTMGIRHLFSFISGGDLSKVEQLGRLLESRKIERTAVMVGDRADDVIAGNTNGLRAIGVIWGFGSYAELAKANPALIVQDVGELRHWLLG